MKREREDIVGYKDESKKQKFEGKTHDVFYLILYHLFFYSF